MQEAENISIYRRRREQLAQAMRSGVALIPTAPERVRNRDSHFPYRFDSHFYYLTGFAEPGAALVIVAGEKPQSLLFCRERNEEREIWDGFRYGPERAKERFSFDEAHPTDDLDEALPKLLGILRFEAMREQFWHCSAKISIQPWLSRKSSLKQTGNRSAARGAVF